MFLNGHYKLLVRKIIPSIVVQNVNSISTGSMLFIVNYYEALGIKKNSTQGEIKAAYYRLSMLYHPDKNQGSETAAVKFREITKAYEVLGNFRLRRLYDKGVIHTADSEYTRKTEPGANVEYEVQDDPSTKFYKSRFTKSKVADVKGRTPIYNYDEWTKQHYGDSFERRQAAKFKFERTETQKKEHGFLKQTEILICSFALLCVLLYFQFMSESSYDTPKDKAIKSVEEKENKRRV